MTMEHRLGKPARRVAISAAILAALIAVGAAALPADNPSTAGAFDPPPTRSATQALTALGRTTVPASRPVDTSSPSTTVPPPTTTRPPTTTTSSTVPPPPPSPSTTVAAPSDTLPAEPIAPPEDVRGPEPLIELGGIAIPRLGVEAPLLEGIRLTTLDRGPGHWPGTAMPGETGNVVVGGHRTSHGAPFRDLDQLVPGDLVVFTTEAGVSEYTVTGTQVVEPDALWIADPTDTPTATLFACHPLGSTSHRIIVNLELAR